MDSGFSKIFIEIAAANNITKAAESLGYTQSGLSHTLNRAEEELGFKLFYRARPRASCFCLLQRRWSADLRKCMRQFPPYRA